MKPLTFKIFNAVFVCGFFTFYMTYEDYAVQKLEALTYQGLLLLSLYCVSALLDEVTTATKGATNLLQNISFPLAIFISLLSWVLSIPVDLGGLWTFKNHFFHTINSLSCLLSIASYPQVWCPRQCFIPLLYGLAYVAFAGARQSAGNPALYPFLDFQHSPEVAAVIVLISVVLLPAIHVMLSAVSTVIGQRKTVDIGKRK